jgi:hypothetical protein
MRCHLSLELAAGLGANFAGRLMQAFTGAWREKRREADAEDLSGNLVVELGLATEALNRNWYERNNGQTIECVQHRLRHPVLRWMGATLDGRRPRSIWPKPQHNM